MTNRAYPGTRMNRLSCLIGLMVLGLSAPCFLGAVAEANDHVRPSTGVADDLLGSAMRNAGPPTLAQSISKTPAVKTSVPAVKKTKSKAVVESASKEAAASSVAAQGKVAARATTPASTKSVPGTQNSSRALPSTDYGVPPALKALPKPVIRRVKRPSSKHGTRAAPTSTTRRGAHGVYNAARHPHPYRSTMPTPYVAQPKTPAPVIYASPPPPAHILVQYECFT